MKGKMYTGLPKKWLPIREVSEREYQGRVVYKSFYDGKIGYDVKNGQKTIADPSAIQR